MGLFMPQNRLFTYYLWWLNLLLGCIAWVAQKVPSVFKVGDWAQFWKLRHAFSIGRTQELLYELEEILARVEKAKEKAKAKAEKQGKVVTKSVWDHLDIIVDSPLAAKFSESYHQLKFLWDGVVLRKVNAGRPRWGLSLLTKMHLDNVENLRKRAVPPLWSRPVVCVAQNYLKALLPDVRTGVLFTGYQAKGTPGWDIQTYAPNISGRSSDCVMLDGQKVVINAQVHSLPGYSAHADQKDLVNVVKLTHHKPKHICLVHGDE